MQLTHGGKLMLDVQTCLGHPVGGYGRKREIMNSRNPNPRNNKKRESAYSFPMRCGKDVIAALDVLATEKGIDRSALAESLITRALDRGSLPPQTPTELLLRAMRRDSRALLRLEEETVDRLYELSDDYGVPTAAIVQVILINAIHRAEKRGARKGAA